MNWYELRGILHKPIAFHRVFAEVAGSAAAGLFLSQAFYWTNVQDETNPKADGWFYKTQKEWQQETALTRREQDTIRRVLKKRGLLQEELKGIPARLYYRIDRDNLLAAISARFNRIEDIDAESQAMHQTAKLGSHKRQTARTKGPHKDGSKRQTLIGAENTPESTQKARVINSSQDTRTVAAQQVYDSLDLPRRAFIDRQVQMTGHSFTQVMLDNENAAVAAMAKRLKSTK